MGSIEGIFVSTPEEISKLIGKSVYFGEILGKHSEVVVGISQENFEEISDDVAFVELFEKHNLNSGYNPFDYHEEDSE
jgi:hypothetical protein